MSEIGGRSPAVSLGFAAGDVVIVTGAGSGIGAATARNAAAVGLRVAAWDLDRAAVDRTVAGLQASGAEAIAVTADVTDAFKTTNDTSLVDSAWGKVPIDVDRACSWLDITCHKGAAEGFGDDPNIPGQKTIAGVFEHTIGKLQAP